MVTILISDTKALRQLRHVRAWYVAKRGVVGTELMKTQVFWDVTACRLLNGSWSSEVSYFLICGYCIYHPSQHCYGQYGFFSYCLKLYSISVQALVSLSLSKFVKTSHIEYKMPRILNGVQYHNACTEFHENPSVAFQAEICQTIGGIGEQTYRQTGLTIFGTACE
jgi:hypothetical protein